jgi:hypothetical protein
MTTTQGRVYVYTVRLRSLSRRAAQADDHPTLGTKQISSRSDGMGKGGLDTTRGRVYGMSALSARRAAQADNPFAPQGTKHTPPLTTQDAYTSRRLISRRRAPEFSRSPWSTIPPLLSISTHLQPCMIRCTHDNDDLASHRLPPCPGAVSLFPKSYSFLELGPSHRRRG